MKNNIIVIIVFVCLCLSTYSVLAVSKRIDLSHYRVAQGELLAYSVPTKEELTQLRFNNSTPTFSLFLGKTYAGFKEALGFKESQGNYRVINQFGYLGKYQFNKNTLLLIGIDDPEVFIKDARLQEKAFNVHTSRNKWILRKDIKRFKNKTINGIKITESGILAAAHLAGAGNVKKFLRSGGEYQFADAFGTTIGYYLKKFSGYDTSHIEPNKQAKVM